MNSKVIIHKCADPDVANSVAREIARWTGRTPETIIGIVMTKTTCVRKDADEIEAQQLRELYESLGAEVELLPCELPPSPAPTKTNSASEDEDEEVAGRLLTVEEYVRKVNERKDIFYFEGSRRLKNTEMIACVCAVVFGIFLSTREITVGAGTDFYEKDLKTLSGTVHTGEIQRPPKPEEANVTPKTPQLTERKTLRTPKNQGTSGVNGGGGDPRARVTNKGVLGIISGQIKGKTVASADIFGKGGFATDIDAILSGVGGLKNGGSAGVGRAGAAGIGYGIGYQNGFGGNSGGIGDLVDNLFSSTGNALGELRHRGKLEIKPVEFVRGGNAVGSGRSKSSILRVVMQNITALRYAYNKRLRDKPGLEGRITVRFAIDEFGNVIFCELNETTIGDGDLEKVVVAKIRNWKFDKVDKPGDVTEVVYPFVFSQ